MFFMPQLPGSRLGSAVSVGLVLGALIAGGWGLILLRAQLPGWNGVLVPVLVREDRYILRASDHRASLSPPAEPFPVGGEVKEPVQIVRVEPQYPKVARMHSSVMLHGGVCTLEAIITKKGDVESVRVLRSLDPLLDNAAIRAVQQWKYKPATLEGKPVAVYLTLEVAVRR